MPKTLRLPSERELPEGTRRKFVEEMFLHYREAGRPTLRAISGWINQQNEDEKTELGGTASIETIRRVLTAATIPRNWITVKVIFLALCALGDRDPGQDRWDASYDHEPESYIDVAKRRWNDAMDDPGDLPSRTAPSQRSSFDDEPPF